MPFTYTKESERLQGLFDLNKDTLKLDECLTIENRNFTSSYSHYATENDRNIIENRSFRYIRFIPDCLGPFDKAVIMLHGLNERNWDKYLPWARFISSALKRPVILFPLAHHMNRSQADWLDRKQLLVRFRSRLDKSERSTFANTILSERLQDKPERFLRSGMQTYRDITALVKNLKTDSRLFKPETRFDIFGYSIGAFLGELLLMLDPENLFTDSRLFLFCGGSVLNSMNPLSKSILDLKAVQSLLGFSRRVISRITPGKISEEWEQICTSEEMVYFQSMLSFESFKQQRDQRLCEIGDRIRGIGLKQDKVIPAEAISELLHNRVEIRDFPFLYKHEAPFPIYKEGFEDVDREFQHVFQTASEHFD